MIDALIAAQISSVTPSTGAIAPLVAAFATRACIIFCVSPLRQFISRCMTTSSEPCLRVSI